MAPEARLDVAGWDEWLEYCAGDIARAIALGKYSRHNETIRRTAWELDMMTEWQYLEAMEIPRYDTAIAIKTLDLDKISIVVNNGLDVAQPGSDAFAVDFRCYRLQPAILRSICALGDEIFKHRIKIDTIEY